jgi:hypothetical protein
MAYLKALTWHLSGENEKSWSSDIVTYETANIKTVACTAIPTLVPCYNSNPWTSGSELFGGVVTVSFLKYLPWQAMHFLQHSTHFSKM